MIKSPWVFYLSTAFVVFSGVMGGITEIGRNPTAVELFTHLGYPLYFLTILGVAKILGAIAVVQNKVPFLREWAYAGFFFDLIAAAVSHAVVDGVGATMGPALFVLVVTTVSYVSSKHYWKASV